MASRWSRRNVLIASLVHGDRRPAHGRYGYGILTYLRWSWIRASHAHPHETYYFQPCPLPRGRVSAPQYGKCSAY